MNFVSYTVIFMIFINISDQAYSDGNIVAFIKDYLKYDVIITETGFSAVTEASASLSVIKESVAIVKAPVTITVFPKLILCYN